MSAGSVPTTAALAPIEAHNRPGRTVEIIYPPAEFGDHNDVLQKKERAA